MYSYLVIPFLYVARKLKSRTVEQGSCWKEPSTKVCFCVVIKEFYLVLLLYNCSITIVILRDCPGLCNRQMRGEDLHGLNIEELQQLEKMLEVGLSRVLETKVCLCCFCIRHEECFVHMVTLRVSILFREIGSWRRSLLLKGRLDYNFHYKEVFWVLYSYFRNKPHLFQDLMF